MATANGLGDLNKLTFVEMIARFPNEEAAICDETASPLDGCF